MKGVRVIFDKSSKHPKPEAGKFEAVYALKGIAKGFPLEEELEKERREARLREDAPDYKR